MRYQHLSPARSEFRSGNFVARRPASAPLSRSDRVYDSRAPGLTPETQPQAPETQSDLRVDRPVWRLCVDGADELRQPGVTELLADGGVLTGVEPVMVDHALEEIAIATLQLGSATDDMSLEIVARQRIELRIGRRGDRAPRIEHALQRRRARRPPGDELAIDIRKWPLTARPGDEVLLLLPGKVPHVPVNRVHRPNAPAHPTGCAKREDRQLARLHSLRGGG